VEHTARVLRTDRVAKERLRNVGTSVNKLFEGGDGGCVRVYVDRQSRSIGDREKHHRQSTSIFSQSRK